MRFRLVRVALGLFALFCAFLLLRMLDGGSLSESPRWVAAFWTIGLLLSLLAAPLLIGNGLGLFSSELLASVGTGRAPTARQWVAVYFGMAGSVVAVALVLHFLAGVSLARSAFVLTALLFLVASSGRPWWLYGTIRRMGWFALLSDERVFRLILRIAAALLLLLGLLGPEDT